MNSIGALTKEGIKLVADELARMKRIEYKD